VADINDLLSRLSRREEFDRRGPEPAGSGHPAQAQSAPADRPAGSEAGFRDVLDVVAGVVGRHAGMSVMVALADGRPGRPVVRVTERDGRVETALVVAGGRSAPAPPSSAIDDGGLGHGGEPVGGVRLEASDHAVLEHDGQPGDWVRLEVPEHGVSGPGGGVRPELPEHGVSGPGGGVHPEVRDHGPLGPGGEPGDGVRLEAPDRGLLGHGGGPGGGVRLQVPDRAVLEPSGDRGPVARPAEDRPVSEHGPGPGGAYATDRVPVGVDGRPVDAARASRVEPPERDPHRLGSAESVEPGGWHAAPLVRPHVSTDRAGPAPGRPRHATSWQNDMWPADRRPGSGRHGGRRLDPEAEPATPEPPVRAPEASARPEAPTGPATEPVSPGSFVLPPATSQVVARLAELLREDPGLAAGWGSEAEET
jgi:hypothetical protein